ncbi:copper homeostasis protein CutC [Bifidobacterium stellenboschense]|uniref:PF03932 family protein CutC n=1 Tax=Bifidobacterium stellenboschense TaxID=762211 RepID=A0A087DJM0_9BIFI|nr:copper homeostasis protein CutC [Bifidobacterium stellenboschense]KFI95720.1 copper homeostasis protein [Bifidobacterium stellenboschense]
MNKPMNAKKDASETPATPVLEIAVQDARGAAVAAAAGADRVELCAALGATGGLTPSYGAIRLCAAAAAGAFGESGASSEYGASGDDPNDADAVPPRIPLGVQALIRNRGGDFVYDADDQTMQLADIGPALEAGAAGVVVGGLRADGTIDEDFARRLIDRAHEEAARLGRAHVDVTFHRAFDMVPAAARCEALETLIALGYTRVLTSGGAASVPDGVDALAELADWAGGRIQIMAGGGLRPADFARVAATGVDALHLSAKTVVRSAGGPGGGGDSAYERTDSAQVAAAVRAVRSVRGADCL